MKTYISIVIPMQGEPAGCPGRHWTSAELRELIWRGLASDIGPTNYRAQRAGKAKLLYIDAEAVKQIQQKCAEYGCSRNALIEAWIETMEVV